MKEPQIDDVETNKESWATNNLSSKMIIVPLKLR